MCNHNIMDPVTVLSSMQHKDSKEGISKDGKDSRDSKDSKDSKDSIIKDSGSNCFLNAQWSVWIHHNSCDKWTESDYTLLYVIDNLQTFWSFFNHFYLLDKSKYQFFIMKNKIKPIWEDDANRNGGICSLKMSSITGNIDIGSEILMCLCLLIMNDTFIPDSNCVNGVSYAIKKNSILIKIWYDDFNFKIVDGMPRVLLEKIENIIRTSTPYKKFDVIQNIMCKPIQPES